VGLKTQTILVHPGVLNGGPGELLAGLGYDKRRKIDDVPFSHAGGGSIWIGSIGDCIVIETNLAWNFIEDDQGDHMEFTDFKNALFRCFPKADIAVLGLHSVIEAWGFAVFRGGNVVRRQYGYDGMTLRDEGARLPVEETYLSRFHRSETGGEIKYKDPEHPENGDMIDCDFGEPLVLEICRSYTGFPLDQLKAPGANFWLNDDEAIFLSRFPPRPWWKFWG
jgi:hypothetical protein